MTAHTSIERQGNVNDGGDDDDDDVDKLMIVKTTWGDSIIDSLIRLSSYSPFDDDDDSFTHSITLNRMLSDDDDDDDVDDDDDFQLFDCWNVINYATEFGTRMFQQES